MAEKPSNVLNNTKKPGAKKINMAENSKPAKSISGAIERKTDADIFKNQKNYCTQQNLKLLLTTQYIFFCLNLCASVNNG
jgi:hypothetical protein